MAAAVHERLHLRGAPLREARNVLAREAEHVRHHPLRQRPRELGYELHLAAIDPRVDEFVHATRDHFGVAAGAGPTHGSVSSCRCARQSSIVGRSVSIEAIIAFVCGTCSGGRPDCFN